jgi:hypothetical protein
MLLYRYVHSIGPGSSYLECPFQPCDSTMRPPNKHREAVIIVRA